MESLCERVRRLDFAFPNHQSLPPEDFECALVRAITPLVPVEFWSPVVLSRFRYVREFTAVVAMPEAAVHKDNFAALPEDQVGPSRKLMIVEPVSVAESVHKSSHGELRL
jgi:hypothetical protein